jgi:hypothetical protein
MFMQAGSIARNVDIDGRNVIQDVRGAGLRGLGLAGHQAVAPPSADRRAGRAD